MTITIELPDDLVPCYKKFIERYFGDISIEEYFLQQVNATSDRVEEDFPRASTVEIREQMAELKAQAEESRKAILSTPKQK